MKFFFLSQSHSRQPSKNCLWFIRSCFELGEGEKEREKANNMDENDGEGETVREIRRECKDENRRERYKPSC